MLLDVMKQVGDMYLQTTRRFTLLFTTVMMFGFTLYRTDVVLKTDGFNLRQPLIWHVKVYHVVLRS